MDRKKIVNVDEEKLKMMMAGDIPIKADPAKDVISKNDGVPANATGDTKGREEPRGEEAKPAQVNNEPEIKEGKNDIPEIYQEATRGIKRKKNKKGYAELFLCKPAMNSRRQSTILFDEAVYINVNRILKMADGISISNFINNVLKNHFEEYEEEIIEIKKRYINNL